KNVAYGEALLDLLKEDRIHLLDLEDEDLRQFDAAAVATISERLKSDQEDVTLSAIELLRTIASPPARTALQSCVPFASLRATAAALQAIASIGGEGTDEFLRPYLLAPPPSMHHSRRYVWRPCRGYCSSGMPRCGSAPPVYLTILMSRYAPRRWSWCWSIHRVQTTGAPISVGRPCLTRLTQRRNSPPS